MVNWKICGIDYGDYDDDEDNKRSAVCTHKISPM
jgi:hypothetical protein